MSSGFSRGNQLIRVGESSENDLSKTQAKSESLTFLYEPPLPALEKEEQNSERQPVDPAKFIEDGPPDFDASTLRMVTVKKVNDLDIFIFNH